MKSGLWVITLCPEETHHHTPLCLENPDREEATHVWEQKEGWDVAATQFCQEQKTDLRNNIFILQSVPAYRIVQYMFVLVTYKYLYRATAVVTVPQEEPDPHSIEMTLSPSPTPLIFLL